MRRCSCGEPLEPHKRICGSCRVSNVRARDKERKAPGPTALGYGAAHHKERKRWVPLVAAGNVPCARCGELILGAFDLDHADGDKTSYLGPSHPACNRSTAGRRRATSRQW